MLILSPSHFRNFVKWLKLIFTNFEYLNVAQFPHQKIRKSAKPFYYSNNTSEEFEQESLELVLLRLDNFAFVLCMRSRQLSVTFSSSHLSNLKVWFVIITKWKKLWMINFEFFAVAKHPYIGLKSFLQVCFCRDFARLVWVGFAEIALGYVRLDSQNVVRSSLISPSHVFGYQLHCF